jgi:hypothetical protein
MDLDIEPTLPLPPAMNINPLPLPQHTIPEDDFQPDDETDDDPSLSEPYDEHLENLGLEEEFRMFENIRYGVLPVSGCWFWRQLSHYSEQRETFRNMILPFARPLHGSFGPEFRGTCFQPSLMDLVPLLKKAFPRLTPSMLVPGNSPELSQHGTTVV